MDAITQVLMDLDFPEPCGCRVYEAGTYEATPKERPDNLRMVVKTCQCTPSLPFSFPSVPSLCRCCLQNECLSLSPHTHPPTATKCCSCEEEPVDYHIWFFKDCDLLIFDLPDHGVRSPHFFFFCLCDAWC